MAGPRGPEKVSQNDWRDGPPFRPTAPAALTGGVGRTGQGVDRQWNAFDLAIGDHHLADERLEPADNDRSGANLDHLADDDQPIADADRIAKPHLLQPAETHHF